MMDSLDPNPYHRTLSFQMTNGRETVSQVIQMGDIILTAIQIKRQYRILAPPDSVTKVFGGYLADKFPDPAKLGEMPDAELAQVCVDFLNSFKVDTWKLL